MEPENVAVSSTGEGIKNEEAASVSGSDLGLGVEIVSRKEKEIIAVNLGAGKGRKSSARRSNSSPAKRKVKVDWTPELHKRFVEAVERLGLDKAVPSRILELMGIDCLTRHNIASHLQKYRSHRKNVLAREAEATSWSQRRKTYGGFGANKEVNPWIAPPSMGFPPVMPATHFRPLHVWGHPSVDQSLVHMWPKHVAPPPPWPLPHSVPPFPPGDPSFWHNQHQFVPATGTPWYPLHSPQMRSPIQAFPNAPPHDATYKVDHQPPSDVPPSNESIDAAIGEVLARPWLPLPLGLKPPSVDSVMVELKHQGISKIPPSSCA